MTDKARRKCSLNRMKIMNNTLHFVQTRSVFGYFQTSWGIWTLPHVSRVSLPLALTVEGKTENERTLDGWMVSQRGWEAVVAPTPWRRQRGLRVRFCRRCQQKQDGVCAPEWVLKNHNIFRSKERTDATGPAGAGGRGEAEMTPLQPPHLRTPPLPPVTTCSGWKPVRFSIVKQMHQLCLFVAGAWGLRRGSLIPANVTSSMFANLPPPPDNVPLTGAFCASCLNGRTGKTSGGFAVVILILVTLHLSPSR